MNRFAKQIVESRRQMVESLPVAHADPVGEGGCGVVGFAANVPIDGRNIFEASVQMHNRGNGKGGGIAAAGLSPEQMGVDEKTLTENYLLQIALLDPDAESRVEDSFISPDLVITHKTSVPHIDDHRDIGLEVRPPDVTRYFVRVKDESLSRFAEENGLTDAQHRVVEDEFIYRNSFKLNQRFYASLGEKEAFVMSHARDLLIFKIVGYAEQVVQYYELDDTSAHLWIAHQRYPTKGRVWHPAGAHPFIGLNEALVHNGDFANYFSIVQYLRQHNVVPQFLTDTEASALLFDMLTRTYGYPLEYVIEALAPTMELDFDCLPDEKKKVYRAIQALHMHGSPDGPWFFIIARSNPDERKYELVGITDTAMLRPQVFALQEGDATIGLVGSEKQAIDATLKALSQHDSRFRPVADVYWTARGGSHSDGGSFSFMIEKGEGGEAKLCCSDKFGAKIVCPTGEWTVDLDLDPVAPGNADVIAEKIAGAPATTSEAVLAEVEAGITSWGFDNVRWVLERIRSVALKDSTTFEWAVLTLALLNNRRFDCGSLKRSVFVELTRDCIDSILGSAPLLSDGGGSLGVCRVDWDTRKALVAPRDTASVLVIDASEFPPEGDECDSRLIVAAVQLGWRRFMVYGLRGQRFTGCGIGPKSEGIRIDVFGSSGDYLGSGIDGMEIHVHDSAQDQFGQIMKSGTIVVHGDVGQTFMYGAKGGDVYVLGNAAGRPLINAVGRPRVVINGTCLDFLAESFMAGDPLNGGGFVILNGIKHNESGDVIDLESPYPGANLFSLASGGAIYIRDPHCKLVDDQLNGGVFTEFTEADWDLILPYLQENEKHFGISIDEELLAVDGIKRAATEVYRKVCPEQH